MRFGDITASSPTQAGSCEIIRKHLLEIWCGGNQAQFEYLWNLWARQIQRPGTSQQVMPILQSQVQGAGKDLPLVLLASSTRRRAWRASRTSYRSSLRRNLRAVAELISDWFGTNSILRQHFAAGLDAHVATAMAMTGKADPADVTPEERELAKPCNFGPLYRMGNDGFFDYLRANFVPNITYSEAWELRARFFVAYPDMARWQVDYARLSRELGYTQTVAGRRWKWAWKADPLNVDEDEPFYVDRLIGFNGSYAVNHPVQGSCAEVMQIALTRLDRALACEPVQLVATVHDEVVLLVPDDTGSITRVGGIAQREMVAAFREIFPKAPTRNLVEPKVGPTWGDLQSLEDWQADGTDLLASRGF